MPATLNRGPFGEGIPPQSHPDVATQSQPPPARRSIRALEGLECWSTYLVRSTTYFSGSSTATDFMSTHADTTATRPSLEKLAARLGIQPSYVDQSGETLRLTTDATREPLLSATGTDASTEERPAEPV